MVLNNLKNGFCFHSNGGWPNEGGSLVYWTVQRGKVEAGPFQPGFVFSCHASQRRINRIDQCLYFKIHVGTLNHLELLVNKLKI